MQDESTLWGDRLLVAVDFDGVLHQKSGRFSDEVTDDHGMHFTSWADVESKLLAASADSSVE